MDFESHWSLWHSSQCQGAAPWASLPLAHTPLPLPTLLSGLLNPSYRGLSLGWCLDAHGRNSCGMAGSNKGDFSSLTSHLSGVSKPASSQEGPEAPRPSPPAHQP